MDLQDEDSNDSRPFFDEVTLEELSLRLLKDRSKAPITKLRVILYMLGAHLLGWSMALLIPSWFANIPLGSGDEINQIIPPIRTKFVTFEYKTDDWVPGPNDPNVTDAIFENWTKLLPNGQGMVKVPDPNEHLFLARPSHLINNDLAYNTAWVHQLHCVYWIMAEYHRVLHHGPNGQEYFIDLTHNSYHTSHCFNYIRQAILCGLDTTLEGEGDGVGVADGSGQVHVCRDREQSIEWLEANRFIDWRAIA